MENTDYIHEYINQMKGIQTLFLDFFDDNGNQEEIDKIIKILDDLKVREDKRNLKIILHLITIITSDKPESDKFYVKIFQILKIYFNEIKQFYTNFEIFLIFKQQKRILLFLFENKIIIPDELIASFISDGNYMKKGYSGFFYPEFSHFFNEKTKININPKLLQNDCEVLKKGRKIVKFYRPIEKLIRDDSINDFISYVNSENIPLDYKINARIIEASNFLIKKEIRLIDYAAFCGSIQIFKYLVSNKVEMKPFLWLSAIHGNNSEIIHILEDSNIQPPNDNFLICLKEAIKCHFNDLAKYIKNNFLNDEGENKLTFISLCLKYYNFEMLDEIDCSFNDFLNRDIFYFLIKKEYSEIVDFIIKNENHEILDVNKIS